MTYAVLRTNGDLIWFDAITQFSERLPGSLSKHPLESGNVINDHTTTDNLSISLSGVISDADFNLDRPTITDEDAGAWGISNKQFVNNSPIEDPVIIRSVAPDTRLLPESISQYLGPEKWEVEVPIYERPKFAIKIKDELTYIQRNAENFSLVDFRDGRIWRVLDNCVLTNLSFDEGPESGDAVYPVMEIEQARYATTRLTKIIKNKGRKSGNKTIRDKKKGDDPKTEATDNAQKNDSSIINSEIFSASENAAKE